jgi:hypothetical protein
MSESVASTTSALSGDASVCDDIEELIDRCQDLHDHIHNTYETLQSIKSLIENHSSIMVTYRGWTGDFDELLERFHTNALTTIKEKSYTNFGEILLNALNDIEFK